MVLVIRQLQLFNDEDGAQAVDSDADTREFTDEEMAILHAEIAKALQAMRDNPEANLTHSARTEPKY